MPLCVCVCEKIEIALSCSFRAAGSLCYLLFTPGLFATNKTYWISDPLCGLKYRTNLLFCLSSECLLPSHILSLLIFSITGNLISFTYVTQCFVLFLPASTPFSLFFPELLRCLLYCF